jgi:hypothetical protein
MDTECIKVESVSKNINKLETKTPMTKEPLTKEYFCNILDPPRTRINFKCNKDNNQHILTADYVVQWGTYKDKNP